MATSKPTQLGMVGLGRMGANLVRRLMRDGHPCVAFDVNADAVKQLESEGALGAGTLEEFVEKLDKPRNIWLMLPAAIVDSTLETLIPLLDADDAVIDGGNSYYRDDIARVKRLAPKKIHYVDCGTSGGVWGLERGFCLMIGGEDVAVARLDPIFKTIAPGVGDVEPTPGRTRTDGTAPEGYLHCGPNGAGHFVKMVHNGIEYGMMAAIAEGLSIIKHANAGMGKQIVDAETTPLRDPEMYQYEIDVAEVAEVWRRGSVVGSWLVDLTAAALAKSPQLEEFAGRVSDSGEGRWTVVAAIDEGVPAPVITTALIERFESRGLGEFTDKILSAMRSEFGGHDEKKAGRMDHDLEVLPTPEEVAAAGVYFVADHVWQAVQKRGRFTFGVSGGRTPWAMFAELTHEDVPWDKVVIFQVDERVAPDGDPDRNLTHLRDSLGDAPTKVIAMPVNDDDLDAATARYSAALPGRFDLVHLGLGPDGHTASLVPGDPVLQSDRMVALTGEYQGHRRMTLTLPALAVAEQLLWLVTGADKQSALLKLLGGERDIPAGQVHAAPLARAR